jgi:hypothetical protein
LAASQDRFHDSLDGVETLHLKANLQRPDPVTGVFPFIERRVDIFGDRRSRTGGCAGFFGFLPCDLCGRQAGCTQG